MSDENKKDKGLKIIWQDWALWIVMLVYLSIFCVMLRWWLNQTHAFLEYAEPSIANKEVLIMITQFLAFCLLSLLVYWSGRVCLQMQNHYQQRWNEAFAQQERLSIANQTDRSVSDDLKHWHNLLKDFDSTVKKSQEYQDVYQAILSKIKNQVEKDTKPA